MADEVLSRKIDKLTGSEPGRVVAIWKGAIITCAP
jgi:hypothetical protein